MEPEQLKASNALGTQCVCITSLFLSKAKVDSVAATWMTAMALEHLYRYLKDNPDDVNKFINEYKASQNG